MTAQLVDWADLPQEEQLIWLTTWAKERGYRLVKRKTKADKKPRRCRWCHTTEMGPRHKYCSTECSRAYHRSQRPSRATSQPKPAKRPKLIRQPRTEAEWDAWLEEQSRRRA